MKELSPRREIKLREGEMKQKLFSVTSSSNLYFSLKYMYSKKSMLLSLFLMLAMKSIEMLCCPFFLKASKSASYSVAFSLTSFLGVYTIFGRGCSSTLSKVMKVLFWKGKVNWAPPLRFMVIFPFSFGLSWYLVSYPLILSRNPMELPKELSKSLRIPLCVYCCPWDSVPKSPKQSTKIKITKTTIITLWLVVSFSEMFFISEFLTFFSEIYSSKE